MRKKYGFLREGEKLKRSDIAKHHCGSYWFETKGGIKECHLVDEICAAAKCYKRLLEMKKK